ncbi:MAG: hypothetical protein LAT63_10595 [Marinobacter sp.]|nr:hypothetical protein [Marinobacter sp.]
MSSAERILTQLPVLYRPEVGLDEEDWLLSFVLATGGLLDDVSRLSSDVMQAHWFGYADSALYSRWVSKDRARRNMGPMQLQDVALHQHPYLQDLPRLASMLDLFPWREPLKDKERVEAFRQRVRHIVQLYKGGVGTLSALRTMTRASLPHLDPEAPAGLRERPFTIEEFSGAATPHWQAAQPKGYPDEKVGPLMRWQLNNDGLFACTPTIIIGGVDSSEPGIDPTQDPIIEQFDPLTGIGRGIYYPGTLAPGQALALTPNYQSWLGGPNGLSVSSTPPADLAPTNPTAPGPWQSGGLDEAVVALASTDDGFIWAATGDPQSTLWRSDGESWSALFSDLPRIHHLHASGHQLWIATEQGLTQLDTQAEGGPAFTIAPDDLDSDGVHHLCRDDQGGWWAATALGSARLDPDDGSLHYVGLGARPETETTLYCVATDTDGSLLFGGELGVFLYRPLQQRWFYLAREGVDDGHQDWDPFDPAQDALPAAGSIELPPVNAIQRGPDMALWFGTDQGIASYRAHEQRRTFTTLLLAMPALTEATVHNIYRDARHQLWFATDHGLFMFNEVDWFQLQDETLVRLPRPEMDPRQPTFWRYHRDTGQWQSVTPPSHTGFVSYTDGANVPPQDPVHCMLWTASTHAVLGSFDGTAFTPDPDAIPATPITRYKPDPIRVVDGGAATPPMLPTGRSWWRYLQREPETLPTPNITPAWSCEGRLLPAPDQAKAPFEGRYLKALQMAQDNSVFAFNPAARVWFLWYPPQPLTVTVRLATLEPDERIDPIILDRVWQSCQRVRPAGVRLLLAVDETLKRGL